MDYMELKPGYRISRVIRGNWQLASGHGTTTDVSQAVDALVGAADAGITTFDCADIYSGVEEIIGAFRETYRDLRGAEALERLRVHTKCVPDLTILDRITRQDVEATIDRSLRRLRVECLDLVQFHWWDVDIPGWQGVAFWLEDMRQAGKINALGLTNFDSKRTEELCTLGLPLLTAQIQYSLLDDRPAHGLAQAGQVHDFHLLCYGTNAGGFLADRWLGRTEPTGDLENRSLIKYKLIIDDRGGWEPFQGLLATLRGIADRHATDIATIASRAMLDCPRVAAVIVGARNKAHLKSNAAICDIQLSKDDHAKIDAATTDMPRLEGDVFELERDRHGRHGAIMKYNLNDPVEG